MIRAVSAYAHDPERGVPPPELVKWREVRDTGALPVAGGLDDQPAGLVRRMRVAAHVAQVMPEFWKLPQPQFEERYPGSMGLVKLVLKLQAEEAEARSVASNRLQQV